MRHQTATSTGEGTGSTNMVIDEYGTSRHAHWNGSAAMYDATLGASGNASEIDAQWCNDVTLNIKNACIEGNGEAGPGADDDPDDPFELAKAVNSSVDVYAGTSNFVASGLTFSTGGASLDVTCVAGKIVYGGRKYHVTLAQLNAATVTINAVESGTGNACTLRASRDHYFYIRPLDDDDSTVIAAMTARYAITVEDVPNGDPVPSTPADTFLYAMLETDGSGVSSDPTYYARGAAISGDASALVRFRSPDPSAAPSVSATLVPEGARTVDLGEWQEDADVGRWLTAYVRNLNLRTNYTAGNEGSRVLFSTRNGTTTGGGTSILSMFDSSDYDDGTALYVEIKGCGRNTSDPTDSYSFRIECHAHKDGANWDLDGTGASPDFEGGNAAIADGVGVAFSLSGTNLRLVLTGHSVDNMSWFMKVESVLH